MVRDKTIEGISDIRDESDRNGMRVVIEIKRDAAGDVVLNQLYRHTRLQTSFPVNLLAMNAGRPMQMGLKDVIAAFASFVRKLSCVAPHFYSVKLVIVHILAGLMVALASIDVIIDMIKKAPDAEAARKSLCATPWPASDVADFIALIDDPGHEVVDGHYTLSETQARAILELRLQRLTGMERDKLTDETQALAGRIGDYLDILGSVSRVNEGGRRTIRRT